MMEVVTMGKENPHPFPFVTEPPVSDVRAAIARHHATHAELVAIMRRLLRPAEGMFTRWSTLRRMLTLAGHRTARTHMIVNAVLTAWPDAASGRGGTRRRGPRGVYGVEVTCDLESMRKTVAPKWERQLGKELPPEVQLTAMEYKLSPLKANPANDNAGEPGSYSYGGRLHELVIRVHMRKQDASAYYGTASDYLHTNGWGHHPAGHKAIWALHCEGATRAEIATELGLNENKVQSVIDLHRSRCGIVHR